MKKTQTIDHQFEKDLFNVFGNNQVLLLNTGKILQGEVNAIVGKNTKKKTRCLCPRRREADITEILDGNIRESLRKETEYDKKQKLWLALLKSFMDICMPSLPIRRTDEANK